ncbi:MAG: translocation/assembly module TamB domain-containing protein [Halioglobus sp.]|nr:translocation/assembly module TamB domain-containing protein [Halioglobus sp.]
MLFAVLLVAAVLLAPFTQPGSRVLLGALDRYTPLEVTYGSGSLAGVLQIERLALDSAGIELQMRDISTELALGCLWRSAVCFRRLHIGVLEIDMPAGPADASAPVPETTAGPGSDGEMLVFPVALEARSLVIDRTRVGWPDGEWRQGGASLQVHIRESTVEVSRALVRAARLELREPAVAAAAPQDSIALPRIDLPLVLRVYDLQLQDPAWSVFGMQQQFEQLQLQGQWRHTQLSLEQFSAARAGWGEMTLRGSLQFAGDWPLSATAQLAIDRPPLWAGLHQRRLNLAVDGDLAALALEIAASGNPGLSLAGTVDALDPQLPFDVTVDLSSPAGFTAEDFPGLSGWPEGLQLASPVTLTGSGALQQQTFALRAQATGLGYENLTVALQGEHRDGQVTLQQLLLRDPDGHNQLEAAGELSLREPLRWSVALRSSGIELPRVSDYVFGRLQGSLQVRGSAAGDGWQIAVQRVDVQGHVNDLPASIRGYAALHADLSPARSDLQVQLNGAQLSLQASGNRGEGGHFAMVLGDLGRWQPGSRGTLQLAADMQADGRRLQFEGSYKDVQWQDVEVDEGSATGFVELVGDYNFSLQSVLLAARLADVELEQVELAVQGNKTAVQAALHSTGQVGAELAVTARAQGRDWTGTLASAVVQTPQGAWQLDRDVALQWLGDARQLLVAQHCWTQDRTAICPGELRLGERSSGSLDASGELDVLTGLLPPEMDVEGGFTLHLEGARETDQALKFNGTARAGSVAMTRSYSDGETAQMDWDGANFVVEYSDGALQLSGSISRRAHEAVSVDILLPASRQAELSGTVSLDRLGLTAMAPFVPSLSQLRGEVSGRIDLGGTVDAPRLDGELRLAGGVVTMIGNPTVLEDVELTLAIRGTQADIRGAGLLGGGRVQLDGKLYTRPALRLDLSLSGERHQVLYPPSAALLLSENLRIRATRGLLDIAGDVTVHRAEVELDELPEGSVALSPDVVQVDYTGNPLEAQLPFDMRMDVRILIENRFVIAGSMAHVTLGGELHARQAAGQPLELFGNLNVIGGELRAFQQQLQIKRGVVSFSGPPESAALDIRAQRSINADNVEVGVQVRGTMQALELTLFSTPKMSQAEAMSYLVRGRGLDSGAGTDSTALALSLASGVVNKSTIVSELNKIPGISDVTFGAEGSAEDTAATVSGYIGQRIYLSYGVGLYEPINVLTARLYLRTRLWLEVVSRLENSVDLYYSFDID